jgi:hypothetical protein
MIFQIDIVPAATGNGGRNPLQYPRRGYFSSRRLNGGRSTVAPLSPFHMAVGPYRYLPRRLETTFVNFWICYTFSKNVKNIFLKKSTSSCVRYGDGETTQLLDQIEDLNTNSSKSISIHSLPTTKLQQMPPSCNACETTTSVVAKPAFKQGQRLNLLSTTLINFLVDGLISHYT